MFLWICQRHVYYCYKLVFVRFISTLSLCIMGHERIASPSYKYASTIKSSNFHQLWGWRNTKSSALGCCNNFKESGVKSKSNISMITTPVLKKAESVESCICYEWKFNCAIWGASCFLHSSRLNYALPIGYQFLTSMIVHNCYYSNRD